MNTDLEFSFSQQIEPFYRQLVELLLHDINSLDDSEKQVRLEESCIAIEDLKKEELEEVLPLNHVNFGQQSINDIDPSVAVIYLMVLDNSLETIVAIREQPLQYHRTELDKNSQQKIFQEICQYLDPVFPDSDLLPSVQKLYNWLILPAEDLLQANKITTLVFILDGFLLRLPIAALHDGNQYLIEKYNLAFVPGLQLLPPKTLNRQDFSLLLGGLTKARQGFPALPNVVQEIEQISQLNPKYVLVDEEFTNQSFGEALDKITSPILHLATYVQLSSHLEDSFVLTWRDRLNLNHWRKLREKNSTNSAIELLVLTACTTTEEEPNFPASLGLTRIAICSGAKSTIATLWSTRDRSTINLITEFYRLLSEHNLPLAEALRKAQISLLKDPQYQHPYYWSSFVLIGNWK